MFDDYWRINCRSQILLEKGPSRCHISEERKIPGKYPENPILSEAGGSQKGSLRWATRGPHHP